MERDKVMDVTSGVMKALGGIGVGAIVNGAVKEATRNNNMKLPMKVCVCCAGLLIADMVNNRLISHVDQSNKAAKEMLDDLGIY